MEVRSTSRFVLFVYLNSHYILYLLVANVKQLQILLFNLLTDNMYIEMEFEVTMKGNILNSQAHPYPPNKMLSNQRKVKTSNNLQTKNAQVVSHCPLFPSHKHLLSSLSLLFVPLCLCLLVPSLSLHRATSLTLIFHNVRGR
jgi:hypothetical protein